MSLKSILPILIISIYLFGCSTNKEFNKPTIEKQPESIDLVAETLLISEEDQAKIKKNINTLRSIYNNALNNIDSGNFDLAEEQFEKALTIISNNEIKSEEIYKNNDEYEEIVDLLLEDYKEFMNKRVGYSEKSKTTKSDIEKTDKVTEKSSYHPSFPLEVNDRVNYYIKYYQGRGRKYFTLWLGRKSKYEKLIYDILRSEGLPDDLIYLAMVESGFNTKAHSRARAVGIWQFISSTGRLYGLEINNYVDERKDPLKSTRAAAKHLKHLYADFGDWYLAMAGYNVSKSKVKRAIKRYKTRNFWKLRSLPRETRNHIPKIIAAAIISKNPEKYGFENINHQKPLQYEEVHIDKCIDLAEAAKCAKTDYLTMKDLNSELVTWFTPPYHDGYNLKIPKNTRKIFLKNYAEVPDNKKVSRVVHTVRIGETLSYIARKYHTSIHNIKSVNTLRSIHRLSIGQKLIIPVPPRYEIALMNKKTRTYSRKTPYIPKDKENYQKVIYTVKKGDTLGEIAEIYNTRANNIRRWNSLSYSSYIYPKQKLTIWVKKYQQQLTLNNSNKQNTNLTLNNKNSRETGTGMVHIVRKGETLWSISKIYNVSLNLLLQFNRKNKRSIIKPGEKIIIPDFD